MLPDLLHSNDVNYVNLLQLSLKFKMYNVSSVVIPSRIAMTLIVFVYKMQVK